MIWTRAAFAFGALLRHLRPSSPSRVLPRPSHHISHRGARPSPSLASPTPSCKQISSRSLPPNDNVQSRKHYSRRVRHRLRLVGRLNMHESSLVDSRTLTASRRGPEDALGSKTRHCSSYCSCESISTLRLEPFAVCLCRSRAASSRSRARRTSFRLMPIAITLP